MMTLCPNQEILGAVQEEACADSDAKNPSLIRRIVCKIGFHKYSLKYIPGRPHINPKTGNIDRRDPIIEKYTCIYCDDTYFLGLGRF